MIVELWAKKIGQKGHAYLNNIEVPNGTRDWRIPVRPQLDVVARIGEETAPVTVSESVRVFRWLYDPLNPLMEGKVKFLEE